MRKIKLTIYCCFFVCTVTFFGAWSSPQQNSPTVLTLDFGEHQVVLTEDVLQGGWYNYEDKQNLTHGKSLFSRATTMQESDTFEGTFPDIVQYINRIAPKYEISAFDGQIDFHPHATPRFTVRGQKTGRIIDREKLYADIVAALKGNKYPQVQVTYQTVTPTPIETLLARIKKRAHFSTHCTDNPDRERNIALALGKFNGLRVNAGEQVSFNQIVGKRTAQQGFRTAKIIVNGEYVDGIGGGVCQVSTTLFNAAVQAGLEITESHHHSLRSSYVPLGHDAMVSSGADLRFINNTGAPIYIETNFQNHNLSVTIYGRDKGPQISYRLDTDVIKTINSKEQFEKDLPKTLIKDYTAHPENYEKVLTKHGQVGHVVDTYIETYQGNKRLSRKRLRRSTYQPTPNIYTLRRCATQVTNSVQDVPDNTSSTVFDSRASV